MVAQNTHTHHPGSGLSYSSMPSYSWSSNRSRSVLSMDLVLTQGQVARPLERVAVPPQEDTHADDEEAAAREQQRHLGEHMQSGPAHDVPKAHVMASPRSPGLGP